MARQRPISSKEGKGFSHKKSPVQSSPTQATNEKQESEK